MNTYNVMWEIEVDAENPAEAARAALRHQQPGTSAVVFDVTDEAGETYRIDLDADEFHPSDCDDRE